MILLIADSHTCTLRPAVRQAGQNIAFLDLSSHHFPLPFKSVLEDDQVELAVIECFVSLHQCLALLKDIKSLRPEIPIVFVISSGSDHDVIEALNCGARYCFRKPFDVVQFTERIKTLLKVKRASRERRASIYPPDTPPPERSLITTDMPENLLRVVNFIEDHTSERNLSVSRLAGIACISPFHFCRVFKKHIAKSPMQYLTCLRVEKAKDLIKHSSADMSVSLIATTVGFYDSSSLNKHFKKITGLSPTAYKRSLNVPRQRHSSNPEQK